MGTHFKTGLLFGFVAKLLAKAHLLIHLEELSNSLKWLSLVMPFIHPSHQPHHHCEQPKCQHSVKEYPCVHCPGPQGWFYLPKIQLGISHCGHKKVQEIAVKVTSGAGMKKADWERWFLRIAVCKQRGTHGPSAEQWLPQSWPPQRSWASNCWR